MITHSIHFPPVGGVILPEHRTPAPEPAQTFAKTPLELYRAGLRDTILAQKMLIEISRDLEGETCGRLRVCLGALLRATAALQGLIAIEERERDSQ